MRRTAQKTTLLTVEGEDEDSLCHYLRAEYNVRGCGTSVKIRNAYGRGPENIVKAAIKVDGSFDKRAVLMDTDVPWDANLKALARKHRIQMIGSFPCLDGMVLRILGKPVPTNSTACKEALREVFPRGLSDKRTLQLRLTRVVLEEARARIPALDELLRLLEGR